MIGATIGSAAIGAIGASKAAKAQTKSANAQIDSNERIFAQQTELLDPYNQAGQNALSAYNNELGIGERPAGWQSGFTTTPGYEFQMQQGQQAIDGSAASGGSLFSGATLKAQQQFGQGLAGQEYNNYLNRLSGIAGAGQSAAAGTATAAGNMGAANSNALASMGNAQSAGIIGTSNALTGGIGNMIGISQYQNALNGGSGGGITIGGPNSLFAGGF